MMPVGRRGKGEEGEGRRGGREEGKREEKGERKEGGEDSNLPRLQMYKVQSKVCNLYCSLVKFQYTTMRRSHIVSEVAVHNAVVRGSCNKARISSEASCSSISMATFAEIESDWSERPPTGSTEYSPKPSFR